METRETILKELNAKTVILDKGIDLPYIVSDNYFDRFSSNLMKVIQGLEEEKEVTLPVPNFTMPDNYFSQLSDNILASIKRDEIKDELLLVAPELVTISKEVPYKVSEKYFDNFNVTKKPQTDDAKVLTLYKKKWLQIAAAASIAGVIAISGYFAHYNTSSNDTYASYKSVDVQGSVKKVSDDDLEKYLNNNDYLTVNTDEITGDENEDLNPKQEIKSVSDNELKQYLKEAGEGKKTVKKGI